VRFEMSIRKILRNQPPECRIAGRAGVDYKLKSQQGVRSERNEDI
jgi:hypothetical protein